MAPVKPFLARLRGLFLLAAAAAQVLEASPAPAVSPPTKPAGERWVHHYVNDDGQAPDGQDDADDDTAAFQRALQDGPGIVRAPRGTFYVSEITVPSGVTLAGEGPATILRPRGAGPVVSQRGVDGWQIRDVTFVGAASGDWHERTDEGESAVAVFDCREFTLADIAARDFNGAAIQLEKTMISLERRYPTSRSHLHRITADRNFIGIRFDRRAEYVHASHLSCSFNVVGCAIHAGNVQIAASGFNNNVDGVLVEDKENGSHGCITGCILNHNDRYALHCRNVAHGMAVDGCSFFYGGIKLENCVGVNLSSGMISCAIDAKDNALANRIAGNYVIGSPLDQQFEFAPQTIVEGNFDRQGPWPLNREPQRGE